MPAFTIVTDRGTETVDASRGGDSIRIAVAELERTTGWELKPEGLCRGDICVPVRDRSDLVVDDAVDVRAMAAALRAPFVIDAEVDMAVLGASAGDRASEREGMRVAPDLELRDLDGNVSTWSELGRKKKVLTAWASW